MQLLKLLQKSAAHVEYGVMDINRERVNRLVIGKADALTPDELAFIIRFNPEAIALLLVIEETGGFTATYDNHAPEDSDE